MAVTPAIDLTAAQRQTVLALLSRYLPNTTVWAYGSRVRWTSHPASDLDLVAFARPEQAARVAELGEAFDESDLPFRVDLFVWDDVPESFRERIKTEHVVLEKQERSLSKEWSEVTLGDCIEMNDATYTPREKWPFINYLDTGNLTENRISEIQHLIAGESKIPSRARRKVLAGDMLYSTVRPNQRHFGILKKVPENFLASTGFAVIRGKKDCAHTDFIYWFLAQDSVVEHLHTIAEHSTSAYPSIRPADIEQLRLNLPPLPEQRAIARILGALDDKIELNRRMAKTLDEAVRALFKSWFVDFDPVRAGTDASPHTVHSVSRAFPDEIAGSELGTIPKGWRVLSLADCFNLTMGQSPPGWTYDENGEGLPFFQGSKDFGFRYPTNRKFCAQPNRVAESGDTLVSVRAPVGDVNLAFERCCIGRGVASLRHKSGATSYTYHYISSIRLKLRQYENEGTVFGALNRHQFEQLRVVEPCPKVIDLFESYSRPIDELITGNWLECQTLVVVRDTLLPKLLSGQICIRDAEKIAEATT